MTDPDLTDLDQIAALGEPWASLAWGPGVPAMAAMSWFSADNATHIAQGPDGALVIAKVPRPHTALIGNTASRVAAIVAASEAGLGPRVLASSADTGVVVQEFAAAPWRVGTLLRVGTPAALASYIDARSAFRALPLGLAPRDVFADLEVLGAEMDALDLYRPAEAQPVYDALERMRAAVSGGPTAVPAWGSGEISNVMVDDTGRVLLTGGELSGLSDPLSDIGVMLAELSPFIADDEEVFEAAWGTLHPGALGRARLYGIADDVRAAYTSAIAHAHHPDSPVEFLGYHSWRIRRAAHTVVASGRFESWLADAEEGWN